MPFSVTSVLSELKKRSSPAYRAGMVRYGLPIDRAIGVPVGSIQKLGKQIGKDQALAEALWKSGWYEARMLVAYVADPAALTSGQMDRWCREFDNWGICDTLCFALFDKSPHAWKKVHAWAKKKSEFERRASFALLASLAGHDKKSPDDRFLKTLPLIQKAASDDRNFVKKGVSWALRGIGHRSLVLHRAAVSLATELSKSEEATEKWLGKDVLRDLNRPAVTARLRRRAS
jgi:3-methyladenine DNA glycosylase AlkD